MIMKIGVLIPSTSNQRPWKTVNESYLYKNTLKTFLLTHDKEHQYVFYIGIDRNDPIYDNEDNQRKLIRLCSICTHISLKFIYMDNITKGHLTVMWNRLFEQAYNDDCDYFYQCGDDIEFHTKGWVNDSIDILQKHDNQGVTGPVSNNARIITQTFVSRKHMEWFGYYFPPEIINWCCDDWINMVYYKMGLLFPLTQHYCNNIGGTPRYNINNETNMTNSNLSLRINQLRNFADSLANKQVEKIKKDGLLNKTTGIV